MTERRVLLATMDFPPSRGGIQTMAREILRRAKRTHFHVIAPEQPGSVREDEAFEVPVTRVRPLPLGRRGLGPALTLAAMRELRARPYDAALALHVLVAPGILMARRAPLVVFSHGGELRSGKIRAVARVVFPRARTLLANSQFTASEVVALGAHPERVEVLPVGAPEAAATSPHDVDAVRRRSGDGRLVLSVSRLVSHKGHDMLLRALAALPPDVHCVIVGDGPARATLQNLARSLGVADRVTFAGSVSDEDLPSYFAAADAFALPSRATAEGFEGGGIAFLEAFAYGLPVVAGASGGIPETVTDGETGLLVDADDPAAIARALEQVLTDKALADRLGANAKAVASGERSWARFVERLEDVLAEARGRTS